MVLIILSTGECIEVEGAVSAERRNGSLVCLDSLGHLAATFAAGDVESYTTNEEMAEGIKEEVCEDFTLIEAGEEAQEKDPA